MTPPVVAIPFLTYVLALSAAATVAAERADTSFHRQAPGRTFGVTSDTLWHTDSNVATSSLLADRFSVSESAVLCRVRFWGFYGSSLAQQPEPAPLIETMRIRIYDEVAGLPGTTLFENYVSNPSRSATGISIPTGPNPPEYLFNAPLDACFSLESNTQYWIEIAQVGDIESRFRWENSNTPGEYAVQFPVGSAWSVTIGSGQMAYELWTPEPHTSALLGLALAYRISRRPRRLAPATHPAQ